MDSNQTKEVQEAIDAVEVTLGHLRTAQDYLNSAQNWGIFDMLGGGLFATAIKRGKMNKANQALERARDSVRKMCHELNDVNQTIAIDLKIDAFLSLADYLCDNLLFDWMVQAKINKAQNSVSETINQLNQIQSQLVGLIK